MDNDDDLLTLPQISALLGVHDSTVRVWVLEGRLAGTKDGRKWLVPRSELERMLAEDNSRAARQYRRRQAEQPSTEWSPGADPEATDFVSSTIRGPGR